MKELDFNIGKSRTEFIAELVNGSTNAYIYAKVRPKEKNIYRYYTYLKALHIELLTYISDDGEEAELPEDQDSIKKVFNTVETTFTENGYRPDGSDELYGSEDYNQALENLVKIQLKLSKLRKQIGLDIPSSSEVDPEDAGVSALG